MKKTVVLMLLTIALVVALPGTLFAQSSTSFTSYYKPGNVVASIDGGVSFSPYGFSVAAYPGLEFLLAKYQIGDVIPLDFGAAVKGRLGVGVGSSSGFGIGIGGFGTAHFGFRGMPGDLANIIGRLDFVIGLGLSFDIASAYYTNSGLGFASFGQVNYFLNDSTAISFTEYYWGRNQFADTTIGIHLRFGSKAAAKKAM